MGVRWHCAHCKQSVTVASVDCEHERPTALHARVCPRQQPAGPADIGAWWLLALGALVLACCLWGTP